MVLGALGSRISDALRNMSNAMLVDDKVLNDMLKEIGNALIAADVSVPLVLNLRKAITQQVNMEEMAQGINKRKLIQTAVFQELINLVDPGHKPYVPVKGQTNVIMLVGLQGNGKTTTAGKLGYYYQRKGWKVGLVCADTFRAGAFDQLKQNATKARIPYYGSYTETSPVVVAADGVDKFREEGFEIIIVDTSGRHKQEEALFEEMAEVAEAVEPDTTIFVMDAAIGQAAQDQAEAFRERVDVGSVIITKMDGSAKGGGALSAVAATHSPIVFIGMGEHIDQLEPFDASSFVSRLLGRGDIMGLVSKLQDAGIDQQPELLEKLKQGVFTLRDMADQFQNLLQMGPISSVMSMMPGMSSSMLNSGSDEESARRINMFLSIMDSMTNEELDCDVKFNPSRIARVARGSGTSVNIVSSLLDEFKRFAKVFKKMKGLNMNSRNGPDLSKVLDPRMIQQMGGRSGLQSMMKSFGNMMKGGKLPGM
ncbi:signal recognition particle protein 1 [Thecamonas trahens ATCC 50062]|uniref:Signal recognition particle 54 kDa protein n=1 Tax=Thecamonas trahens ATCC 50062 TaxID=461836 RepID=A0A0L0D6U8_THETB|nr:signal recognition particle protein 1 [Thecamonas trahens ATCC 50062]KNC47826.1 signal recognition particle protein 1 [Thecamonas trahens ATCC 50062]|eukprot:XP_013759304.1 signal recognition particle protein 1 [Thecamonas trahens ATCC 50062]